MNFLARLILAIIPGWLVAAVMIGIALQFVPRERMDLAAGLAVLLGLGTTGTCLWLTRRWGRRTLTAAEMETGFEVHLALPFIMFLVVVGLPSLGILALPFWIQTRRWPKRVNREGVTLRNGGFLRWNDVDDFAKGIRTMGGTPINIWWELRAGKQRASIVVNSLVEGKEVVEFAHETSWGVQKKWHVAA